MIGNPVKTLILLLMMVVAISQPVISGTHVIHMSLAQMEGEHSHIPSVDADSHIHFHHQVPHVDLTLNVTEESSLEGSGMNRVGLPDYNVRFYRIAATPENPPPILRQPV